MTVHGALRLAAKKKARRETEPELSGSLAMESGANQVQASPVLLDTQQMQMVEDSSRLTCASSIASSAQSNVGVAETTEDIAATNTASAGEKAIGSEELLKGFRKRWRERQDLKTTSEKDAESCDLGDRFGEDPNDSLALTEDHDSPSALQLQ